MHEDGIRKIRKKLKLTYFDLVCLLTARNVPNNRETARSWVEKDESVGIVWYNPERTA